MSRADRPRAARATRSCSAVCADPGIAAGASRRTSPDRPTSAAAAAIDSMFPLPNTRSPGPATATNSPAISMSVPAWPAARTTSDRLRATTFRAAPDDCTTRSIRARDHQDGCTITTGPGDATRIDDITARMSSATTTGRSSNSATASSIPSRTADTIASSGSPADGPPNTRTLAGPTSTTVTAVDLSAPMVLTTASK